MENLTLKNTIAAIATPSGNGGIGVIRVSGTDAYEICVRLLNKKNFSPRTAEVCVLKTGEISDEVIALYFKHPHSFTGEDVFEIHCHGGYFLINKILEALIKEGCRLAEAGEFTKRAFLNGKLDLTAAEGIIDLISASSESAVNSASAAVRGETFKKIEKIQNGIKNLLALSGGAVDYPEEDIEEITFEELKNGIKIIKAETEALINSFNGGRFAREGVTVAVYGEPNVGKSTLFNRLCGYERAIVTDEAGTTRDTVEESYVYKGIRFNVTDTAGIRNGLKSAAEKKGIERSEEAVASADVVLAVYETGEEFNLALRNDKKVIFVENKSDKTRKNAAKTDKAVLVSALKGENIDGLKERIFVSAVGKTVTGGSGLNNLRQLSGAEGALEALKRAERAPNLECVISDLSDGYRLLGAVTGAAATDEIVDEIFKRFCVGK
jgi:tRNA modification GTPase